MKTRKQQIENINQIAKQRSYASKRCVYQLYVQVVSVDEVNRKMLCNDGNTYDYKPEDWKYATVHMEMDRARV
jgi:hypothetical protein